MRQLVKQGIEVHVAVPPGGPLVAQYEEAGIVVHLMHVDFPARRPWQLRRTGRQLRTLVKTVAPDLIHSHFVGSTVAARLTLGRTHAIPRIFSVAGPLHLEHRLTRQLDIRTAGPKDFWAGGCEWTCQRYVDAGVPHDRVFLGRHGKDLDSLVTSVPGKLRSELGLSKDIFVVGMVALMYPPKRYLGYTRGIKGHEDLIDAIALLAPEFPNLRCVMIGGAWGSAHQYERAIREYARIRCGDRIIFLGTRYDVPELYPDFNVVVHPSHSENLGGAAESLLLRVPTIASNVGGLPDIVKNGVSGWLVPPKSPAAIAAAIRKVYRDPVGTRAMTQQGKLIAQTICDARRNAVIMANAYDRIVSGRLQ
jgi:glycosyltransferase involved in cell wall biosynthesis